MTTPRLVPMLPLGRILLTQTKHPQTCRWSEGAQVRFAVEAVLGFSLLAGAIMGLCTEDDFASAFHFLTRALFPLQGQEYEVKYALKALALNRHILAHNLNAMCDRDLILTC